MILEKKLLTEENQCRYNKCKQDLEEIYDNNAQGTCIRCQWYFLSLEKCNKTQIQICKIIVNDQEITDPNKMLNELRKYYESFLERVA